MQQVKRKTTTRFRRSFFFLSTNNNFSGSASTTKRATREVSKCAVLGSARFFNDVERKAWPSKNYTNRSSSTCLVFFVVFLSTKHLTSSSHLDLGFTPEKTRRPLKVACVPAC
ncbi:unnamed protein product [Amoebophrya sp. A25]|nr:unnamed protein product [Amoebophrya sp. A25]|eukprot:GSA25T00023094001.1